MVGSGGAGKTTIASRLATGEYLDTTITVGLGVETWSNHDEDSGVEIKASCFDFGGQEQFRFFQSSLLGGTQVVLLVMDLTQFRSYNEIDSWIELVSHVNKDNWVLVANKLDEPNTALTEMDVAEKANELGVPYIMLSAKTGKNFHVLEKTLETLMKSTGNGSDSIQINRKNL
jgi:small GTP-binding protein